MFQFLNLFRSRVLAATRFTAKLVRTGHRRVESSTDDMWRLQPITANQSSCVISTLASVHTPLQCRCRPEIYPQNKCPQSPHLLNTNEYKSQNDFVLWSEMHPALSWHGSLKKRSKLSWFLRRFNLIFIRIWFINASAEGAGKLSCVFWMKTA